MTDLTLGGRWRLWEQFALRGPGFPATGVLRLAPDGLAAAADKFATDTQLQGKPWDDFIELFDDAAVDTAHTLQDIARVPAFRQAVAWQNRPVLSSGIAPFLNWIPTAAGRTSMPRQREELVAHYWQRFCVKNDTIGFFGPVGWGRWDLSTRGVAVDPGTGLLADSQVYFSSWAVDTLATMIDSDPAARQWVAPRRLPFVRQAGTTVTVPGRQPSTVTTEVAAVLAACDGTRRAHDIQSDLPGIDVPGVLAELVRKRWVRWRLEVPADTHPERTLRAWLGHVGDSRLRRRGLDALDLLEQGRDRVRAADGADTLVAALIDLEQQFVALTETAAVREKSARTAPCRALVYSDCRRSATARLGQTVHDALAPLAPLLTSAGWLTSRIAASVVNQVKEVHAGLAGHGPVDLATLWFACLPVLHGQTRADVADLQRTFRDRWGRIVASAPGQRRVRLRLEDVASTVAEQFGGSGDGWSAARYLSPDVMVAATGPDAVERGDFELVLGELHLAANTLGASLFVNQHPDPGQLVELTDRDHPAPRLMPLLPKEHRSRLSARIRHCLLRPQDYQVALVDFTADPRRERTVPSADVTVTDHDGDLVVVMPDGARFPVVDVFSHLLTTLVMDLFTILPEAEHTPRVTIDRLVVARETWRVPAAQLDFAAERNEARRFVRARRWQTQQELPRFVFVVSPTEPRPFYVDFDSPVYVNILAKAVRRLARQDPDARIAISEMLPTPEQTWLTDDKGRPYTSELRFVAFDKR